MMMSMLLILMWLSLLLSGDLTHEEEALMRRKRKDGRNELALKRVVQVVDYAVDAV